MAEPDCDTQRTHEFPVGAMWEGSDWEIRTAEEVSVSTYSCGKPCPHCSPVRVIERRTPHFELREPVVTCPAVVVAKNEDGHNSTGVCLLCILEAAAKLGITAPGEATP